MSSVNKTGRLVIVDSSWKQAGISSSIAAEVYSKLFNKLKAPIEIITIPDYPTPTAENLESLYYPNAEKIIKCCHRTMEVH